MDSYKPEVLVVVMTWNQKQMTLDCLKSLLDMEYPNYHVLLIDNGSEDGTTATVNENYPDVDILEIKKNIGFSAGFNTGLRYFLSQSVDYVFMISNDTAVAPDLLEVFSQHLSEPQVGMLGPKIYYYDMPQRIWSVGALRHPWTYEMTAKGDNEDDRGQFAKVMERDYLTGCALLMTREMLLDVGLFDEGFTPGYYEDMDLCLRARQAGYRLLLIPEAKIWHKVSAAVGGSGSPQERYLMARHSVRFFRKHIRGWRWMVIIPYRIGSAIKTVFRLIRNKRGSSARSYLKGIRDGLFMSIETKGTM